MKMNEIHIRDPFILPYEGVYYMYGSRGGAQQGFDVYTSTDLEEWNGPKAVFLNSDEFWAEKDFWAPEVHFYNGKFYMFATFISGTRKRGTQILVSDTPDGTFVPHSDGPITPADWMALDGTLYLSPEGKPYMVFCHEWVQIGDGTMCAVELSKDLSRPVSEPVLLWHASDPEMTVDIGGGYVTDGPFFVKKEDQLLCIWSGFDKNGYIEIVSRSDNGRLDGNWSHDSELLFTKDGGHGMIFTTFDGQLKFVCHSPNKSPLERANLHEIALVKEDGLWKRRCIK